VKFAKISAKKISSSGPSMKLKMDKEDNWDDF
jgi:hypothetical protein